MIRTKRFGDFIEELVHLRRGNYDHTGRKPGAVTARVFDVSRYGHDIARADGRPS